MRVMSLGLCLMAFAMGVSAGPVETVQQLFDCIAKHDAETARSLFVPGIAFVSGAPEGKYKATPAEEWLKRLGEAKGEWKESFKGKPTVKEGRGLATVWAPYEFHLDGKLSHCGVDVVDLVKTAEGWRISAVTYSRETAGCEIH